MVHSKKTYQSNCDTMENKKTSAAASFAENTISAGPSSSSKKIAKNMKTPGASKNVFPDSSSSSKMTTKKTPKKMKTLQDSVSSIRSDKTNFTRKNRDILYNNDLSR